MRLWHPRHNLLAQRERVRPALLFQAAILDVGTDPPAQVRPSMSLPYVVGARSLRARVLRISCRPGFALEPTNERHFQKPLLHLWQN